MNRDLCVTEAEAGLTTVEFLQRRIPAAPASYLHQLLKKGKVTGLHGPLTGSQTLAAGMVVQLPASARLDELRAQVVQPAPEVRVLFESRELLIVDKPAGVAIHSSVGHEEDNLTARIAARSAARGEKFRIAPVHRLDLETSGPVMFGKGKQACAAFGRLFIQQQVEKVYLALVAGRLPGSGSLLSPVPAKGKEKEAHTDYVGRLRSDETTLLELRLHSGRQHQIRRQLADLGHPLYGDRRYGGPCPDALPRLFLHCSKLVFQDPFSGANQIVEVPLPTDLKVFLSTQFPADLMLKEGL